MYIIVNFLQSLLISYNIYNNSQLIYIKNCFTYIILKYSLKKNSYY